MSRLDGSQFPVCSGMTEAVSDSRGLSFQAVSSLAHTVHFWFKIANSPAQTSNLWEGSRIPTGLLEEAGPQGQAGDSAPLARGNSVGLRQSYTQPRPPTQGSKPGDSEPSAGDLHRKNLPNRPKRKTFSHMCAECACLIKNLHRNTAANHNKYLTDAQIGIQLPLLFPTSLEQWAYNVAGRAHSIGAGRKRHNVNTHIYTKTFKLHKIPLMYRVSQKRACLHSVSDG